MTQFFDREDFNRGSRQQRKLGNCTYHKEVMQYFSGHSIFRGKFRYAEIYCAFVHNCVIEMKCAQVGVYYQKSGKVMSTNNSHLSFHILLD